LLIFTSANSISGRSILCVLFNSTIR